MKLNEEKILSIILGLTILVWGFMLGALKKDSYHPSVLILYFWSAFYLASMIILWNVEFSMFTAFYLWIALISHSLSALFFPNFSSSMPKKILVSRTSHISGFVFVFPITSIFLSLSVMAASGVNPSEIVSNPAAAAGKFATMRGTVGVNYGLAGVLSIGFSYFSCWYAGFLYGARRLKAASLFLLVTPVFFIMLTQSAKLILFVGMSLFVSGFTFGRFSIGSKALKYSQILKNISKITLSAISVFCIVIYSFTTRDGYRDFDGISNFLDVISFLLSSYLFGSLYAFSDFFVFTLHLESRSNFVNDYGEYGRYTFHSIASWFGYSRDFPIGTYSETGFKEGVFQTNIFTIFRGLIYDFGVSGSIVVFFTIGLFFNLFYYLARRYGNAIFVGIASIYIPFGFISYLISPFMANYLFLQAFLVAAFLIFSKLKFRF